MRQNSSNATYRAIVFAFFAFIIFYAHIPMRYFNDDLNFLSNIRNGSIGDFFVEQFYYNGKIFTDVLANAFYRLPMIVWKFFDTGIYLLIAIIITKIFTDEAWMDALVVCAIIGLFPFWYLSTAGWVATTTNYLYPTLCILVVTLIVKYVLNGCKISVGQCFCAAVSIIYAANQDQAGMIIIGELFLILAYCIVSKLDRKVLSRIALLFVFSVVTYIVLFTMPGHLNRLNSGEEMLFWLPEYADWSFGKKIFRAYTSTVAELMFRHVALYDVFCFMLLLTGICSKKITGIIISAIPLSVNLGSRLLGSDRFLTYPDFAGGMPEIKNYGEGFYGVTVLLLTIITLISIILAICMCVNNQKNKLLIILSLILGAGSRLMMGFSATLYASHARTFTYIVFALMLSCMILLKEIKCNKPALYYVSVGVILASLLHITSPYVLQYDILGQF